MLHLPRPKILFAMLIVTELLEMRKNCLIGMRGNCLVFVTVAEYFFVIVVLSVFVRLTVFVELVFLYFILVDIVCWRAWDSC